MNTRPHRVVRLVRLDDGEPDAAGWVESAGGRGVAILDSDGMTTRRFEEVGPGPAQPHREGSIWRDVFGFFLDGFALYGAALHPMAVVPVHEILRSQQDWRPHEVDHERPTLRPHGPPDGGNGNVVTLDRVRRLDAQPARRWSWLHSLGETLTVLSSHLRREREIKQAVAALMELDDRTLRDLGMCDRSDIERMVRYCRDC
ncbi:DUF1127 domain-containing protein [Bradyrhizobium sp. INPA01-394B]|uniref:DUF1127 domain-containing protein n=1 Tax=Bradyrhizobium campsiandrae TaxID=1729892 RepID=A0ABR7U9A3_9BRAD|nr:DUF1127 domain-containing protein [Bradyrhizobium campsiandrae]MBC9878653.1 DUF1127 domain-containing protein [Bradyrhizobium campsiandrae]MBC9980618.1 DUF1127 domain-containing protein [Bradyrhizobium campsiandrae]